MPAFSIRHLPRIPLALIAAAVVTFCGVQAAHAGAANDGITYQGSSTVYPIMVAMGEKYAQANPRLRFDLVCSGSNAGYRALISRKASIAGMSRSITAREVQACDSAGLPIVEIPIAFDGLTVVVNRRNAYLKDLTTAELRRLFSPGGPTRWNQLRPSFPDAPIALFTPGKDSGTYDFFVESILGRGEAVREDLTTRSEDDHVLVQGVLANPHALGYFGYAYFNDNKDSLRDVAIDHGQGAVAPTPTTILDGTYQPLARPLFLYVAKAQLERPEVTSLLLFTLDQPNLIDEVGYVPIPDGVRATIRERVVARTVGSPVADAPTRTAISALYPAKALPAPLPAATTAALTGTNRAQPMAPSTTRSAGTATKAPAAPALAAPTRPQTSVPIPATQAPATPVVSSPAAPPQIATAAPGPTPAHHPIATPTWQGPSAQAFATELARLRTTSLAAARTCLDDQATLEELVARATELKRQADALAERFRTAPRSATASGLTVAEAAALAP